MCAGLRFQTSFPPIVTGAEFALQKSPAVPYITTPLRADGHPDCAAALDELASKGVTPENNAAVLSQRASYFKRLGIAELSSISRQTSVRS